LAAKDPKFKKIYNSLKAFRTDQNLWFRVAENTFDNFNFSMSAKGRKTEDKDEEKPRRATRRGFLRSGSGPYLKIGAGASSVVGGATMSIFTLLGSIVDGGSRK